MTDKKIELQQVSESTSEASMRDHHVLIDRPQEKGGADRGRMGESFSSPQ
jgi:putative redox protein